MGRLLRRLQDRDCSAVTFAAASDIRDAMRLFCECYRRQWGEPVTAQMPVTQEYWTGLAEAAARLNKRHFSVLKVGEDAWHWHLGFQHRGTLLWYKMTYDSKFSQDSPGMLHLALLVQDGIKRGLDMIDLGYGAEPYKFKWDIFKSWTLSGGRLVESPFIAAWYYAVSAGRTLKRRAVTGVQNRGKARTA